MNEIRVFNIKVHPLLKTEFLSEVESDIKKGRQIVQNGINASTINLLNNNNELISIFNNSDLVNIDGMSVVWALRFIGYKVPERVACPDLAIDILKMAENHNYSVFLFGAQEESLNSCIKRIIEIFPHLKIAGHRNGYFKKEDELEIVNLINKTNPDILFLGMPSPEKEYFADKYKGILTAKYIFGVGGLFDIFSGLAKRAPVWMQKVGLEWFYRFIQEPRRLWKRYLIGNIKFIRLVIKEKLNNLDRSY